MGYWKTYCGKNANSNYNQTVIFKREYHFLSIKLEMIGKIKMKLSCFPQECYLVRSFQHWTTDYHVK